MPSERRIRTLQAKLDELARRVFGKKSEKLEPRQLRLALDLLASAVELSPQGERIESDSGESPPARQRQKSKSRGRRPLPRSLPRRQLVVDLPESEKRCARGHQLQRIGQSMSEKIDFVPASYTVSPLPYCPAFLVHPWLRFTRERSKLLDIHIAIQEQKTA